jgi:anti-sigma factor RsiW
MKCDTANRLVPLMADRMLGALQRWRLTRHLTRCPACAGRLEELETMRTALRTQLTYHRASPALAARIGAMLPADAPAVLHRHFRFPALGFAGSGLAGAVAGVVLTLLLSGGPATNAVMSAAIDAHVRSLMAQHLTDVQTSDQHTVKPWLSAHLDVSPPVQDLAAEGFPLVGGRMDYVDGHPAAVVVYRHARHVINLFAWAAPGKPDVAPASSAQQGFNVVSWRAGGIEFYAVSDVEAAQLAEFVKLVRSEK